MKLDVSAGYSVSEDIGDSTTVWELSRDEFMSGTTVLPAPLLGNLWILWWRSMLALPGY